MKTENVERLASLYSKRVKLDAAIQKLEVIVARETAAAFAKRQERKTASPLASEIKLNPPS
jgi:hypothetical protein